MQLIALFLAAQLAAGGVLCPAPDCIQYWKYNGRKQTACSNPDNHPNGSWCPKSLENGEYEVNSGAFSYCVPCVAEGQPCQGSTLLTCSTGLTCVKADDNSTTCVADQDESCTCEKVAEGQPCHGSTLLTCSTGLTCMKANYKSTTCVAKEGEFCTCEKIAEGQPCQGSTLLPCSTGLTCVKADDKYTTCVADQGESCTCEKVSCSESGIGVVCPACKDRPGITCVASDNNSGGVCETNQSGEHECVPVSCSESDIGEVCPACEGHPGKVCAASDNNSGVCETNQNGEHECVPVAEGQPCQGSALLTCSTGLACVKSDGKSTTCVAAQGKSCTCEKVSCSESGIGVACPACKGHPGKTCVASGNKNGVCETNQIGEHKCVLDIINKGTDACTLSNPCNQCEGDCDSDDDCKGSLKCFQRDGNTELVYGCSGKGLLDNDDYCFALVAEGQPCQGSTLLTCSTGLTCVKTDEKTKACVADDGESCTCEKVSCSESSIGEVCAACERHPGKTCAASHNKSGVCETKQNGEHKCVPGSAAILIKANVECTSDDVKLGTMNDLEACAQQCMNTRGCEFLIYGIEDKKGECFWEKTRNGDCEEGWEVDDYNSYSIRKITCQEYKDSNSGVVCNAKNKEKKNLSSLQCTGKASCENQDACCDSVSCGNHRAAECKECDQGKGRVWCNGDCRWAEEKCVTRHALAEGQPCQGRTVSTCLPWLTCVKADDKSTKCVAGEGEYCTCEKVAEGQPCQGSPLLTCFPGLTCVKADDKSITCVAGRDESCTCEKVAEGQFCKGSTLLTCSTGLTCVKADDKSITCVAGGDESCTCEKVAEGQPCQGSTLLTCSTGLTCVNADDKSITCVAGRDESCTCEKVAEGQPCQGSTLLACSTGLTCVKADDKSITCVAGRGESCTCEKARQVAKQNTTTITTIAVTSSADTTKKIPRSSARAATSTPPVAVFLAIISYHLM